MRDDWEFQSSSPFVLSKKYYIYVLLYQLCLSFFIASSPHLFIAIKLYLIHRNPNHSLTRPFFHKDSVTLKWFMILITRCWTPAIHRFGRMISCKFPTESGCLHGCCCLFHLSKASFARPWDWNTSSNEKSEPDKVSVEKMQDSQLSLAVKKNKSDQSCSHDILSHPLSTPLAPYQDGPGLIWRLLYQIQGLRVWVLHPQKNKTPALSASFL